MPFETCYRCRLEDIPKSERGGEFQAIHRGEPAIPFIGILCLRCAKDLGDWLDSEPQLTVERAEEIEATVFALIRRLGDR